MCKQEQELGFKKLAVAWYTARVSLYGPGPCNLLESNYRVLHWHRDLHGSALATRAWLQGLCSFVLRSSSSLCLVETYTGPCRLHGSNYTIGVLMFLHWFSWLSSSRELHGSMALLTRPVYFVSAAILSLLTSPSFPLHTYTLGLHPNT